MSERQLGEKDLALLASVGRGPDARSTDVASGGGAPLWLEPMIRFCSRCGTKLERSIPPGEDRERMHCPACGFIAYINPRLVVTTLPVTDAGELILIRRGIEPALGSWAQPGGFLEVDETVGEAAVRETLEETGLLVQPGLLIGIYSRLEAVVVTLVFEAQILGGQAHPCAESLEVRPFAPADIPWPEIAFKSSYWGIRDWLNLRHPEVEVPQVFPGRIGV